MNDKPSNKCPFPNCNRKIKLTDFSCRCGLTFCSLHRLSEQHNCSYDYKNLDDKLKKIEELKCISSKIIKI